MKTIKEINPTKIWNKKQQTELKSFVVAQSKKQSTNRLLQNEFLAIQYQLEDYINNNNFEKQIKVSDFVKMYLKALNISQKKLADLFEMKDSNLHKYLSGERKLNTNLVLKLSSFSRTNPETWLRVEVKNDLINLKKENRNLKEYKKYDYENLLMVSE